MPYISVLGSPIILRRAVVGLKYVDIHLRETRTKGAVVKIDRDSVQLDIFANADFVGLFVSEGKNDPVSEKYRIVFLLNFDGAPIFWSSNL